ALPNTGCPVASLVTLNNHSLVDGRTPLIATTYPALPSSISLPGTGVLTRSPVVSVKSSFFQTTSDPQLVPGGGLLIVRRSEPTWKLPKNPLTPMIAKSALSPSFG